MRADGDTFFQAWLSTDAQLGPQHAYRLACHLAKALRPLGRSAAMRADWALAYTLFWRGRFVDAQALLTECTLERVNSQTDAEFAHIDLQLLLIVQKSWNTAVLSDRATALGQVADLAVYTRSDNTPLHRAYAGHALSLLHCLLDQAADCLAWSRTAQVAAADCDDPSLLPQAQILEYWAGSRLRQAQAQDENGVQTALAALRRLGPAQEARSFGLYAQALFHQSPNHAATQLDAALDLNARCGLHLWDARLQHLKALSLDAAGQLTEADRFLHMARETARHQGATLFLNDMTGIESRTPACSTREVTS